MELPRKKGKKSEMSCFPSTSNNSDCEMISDDCYLTDQEKYEKKQKKCKVELREIETKFDYLKNTFYKDQIKELEDKLLKVKLEMRHAVTVELRKFKLVNLERKFNSEKQSIMDQFKYKAEILNEMMIAEQYEKIYHLKAKLNEIDVEARNWLGRSLTQSRGDRKGYPYGYIEPDIVPEVKPWPRTNYMLKEHEILEDWMAIKKLMTPSKQKETAEKNQ